MPILQFRTSVLPCKDNLKNSASRSYVYHKGKGITSCPNFNYLYWLFKKQQPNYMNTSAICTVVTEAHKSTCIPVKFSPKKK